MIQFGGFKPEAQKRIANKLGYSGDMSMFDAFLANNPAAQEQMQQYTKQAINMVMGGMARKNYQEGGMGVDEEEDPSQQPDTTGQPDPLPQTDVNQSGVMTPLQTTGQPTDIGTETASRLFQPALPFGGQVQAAGIQERPDQILGAKINIQKMEAALNAVPRAGIPEYGYGEIKYNPETNQFEQTITTDIRTPATMLEASKRKTKVKQFGTPEELLAQAQFGGGEFGPIPIDPRDLMDTVGGQVTGDVTATASTGTVTEATAPSQGDITTVDPREVVEDVREELKTVHAQTGTVKKEIDPATQDETLVSDLEAETSEAITLNNPVTRQIEEGELIDISQIAGQAEKAAKFAEKIQAAEATPSKQATVQGQLEGLMAQFEDGKTPTWAAGAMRQANAEMARRGLGASSMAGQAIIQAAMESAVPIAQADASTVASFEAQNLSNRQQRAMLAAEQRAKFIGQEFDQTFQARVLNASKVSDIANMNFTAEQQIALENSRAANTMQLANLNNKQAMVMANAAALSNLEMASLSNQQQAAVQNAQNFLQMDLANLSNQQQTEMFSAAQRVQALFTDQAQVNAAEQFNATSQNQVDKFFAELQTNVSQFNATQNNAMAQFNAGEENVIERFNTEIENQRDQFNAQNRLVIDQNNAVWRREIATQETAAINRANELNAQAVLGISNTAYNNLWQYYSDTMEFAYLSAENERQRVNELAKVKLAADAEADLASLKNDYSSSAAFGGLISTLLFSDLSNSVMGGLFKGFGLGL